MLYVVYILVVVIGRYVNQRMKVRHLGEDAVRKNDFSCNSERPRTSSSTSSIVVRPNAINAEDDEYKAEEEYENENLTKPLLTKSHVEELPEVGFSSSDAIKMTFMPIDKDEWRTSNFIFRFMILVKVRDCLLFSDLFIGLTTFIRKRI